jgi:hypothetical protein
MGRAWNLPRLEVWFIEHADSWLLLPNDEYVSLVETAADPVV